MCKQYKIFVKHFEDDLVKQFEPKLIKCNKNFELLKIVTSKKILTHCLIIY